MVSKSKLRCVPVFDAEQDGKKPGTINRNFSESVKEVTFEEKVGQTVENESRGETEVEDIKKELNLNQELRVGIFRFDRSSGTHPLISVFFNRKLALFRVKEVAEMLESQLEGEVI